jgi:hypothetical protein
MSDIFTIRQAAEKYGVRPSAIVYLFYNGTLSNARCPLHGRSRCIPLDYLPVIEQALRERGYLPSQRPTKEAVAIIGAN